MYIRIGSNGELIESIIDKIQYSGLVYLIDNDGKIGEGISNPDMEMFRQSKIYFDHPYISLKDHRKRLNFIAVPACFQGDVYYVLNQHKKEYTFRVIY